LKHRKIKYHSTVAIAAAALLDPERFGGHEIEPGNENLTVAEAAGL
jgi:hypothetical protein